MARILGVLCRECGKTYDIAPVHVCELCFGPLEVQYNYDEIAKTISKTSIADGPISMWRYSDLLPLNLPPCVGHQVGFTPLIRAQPPHVVV
jgi:threonine synthase